MIILSFRRAASLHKSSLARIDMPADHYEVLGVERDAPVEEIGLCVGAT
jgi:hypothetical protein